jgi:hypothetical protein
MDLNGYKRAVMSDISGTRCFLTLIDYESDEMTYFSLSVGLFKDKAKKGKIWAGEFNLANQPFLPPQSELKSIVPEVEMFPVRNVPAGMFIDDNSRFRFKVEPNKTIAVSFNNMGDTLCKFTNYVAESGGAYGSDKSFFYRADGELYFRQEFCDTIFRVQSADQIVPAYCFDFGSQRLSPSESAINKTQGKLMPWKWFDFKTFILLIFTEGRDCPACRTRNEVSFHCLLFDKQTGRSTPIDMKSRYPDNILIENDIDGEIPIPLNSLHREGDVIIATFTKNQIEEILKSNNSTGIESKLKQLEEKLKQNEMLVIKIR